MPKSRLIRSKYLIHPEYQAWRQLKLQMTKQEVLELLGPPRLDSSRKHWEYGYLRFPHRLFKRAFWFMLWFDSSDKLIIIEHPFGVTAPREGKPSVPVIYYPHAEPVYSHYPRYFDVRWSPAAGSYPMSYELQIQREFDQRFYPSETETNILHPHYVAIHSGAQRGRIRVRASNALGRSKWSPFSMFTFTR